MTTATLPYRPLTSSTASTTPRSPVITTPDSTTPRRTQRRIRLTADEASWLQAEGYLTTGSVKRLSPQISLMLAGAEIHAEQILPRLAATERARKIVRASLSVCGVSDSAAPLGYVPEGTRLEVARARLEAQNLTPGVREAVEATMLAITTPAAHTANTCIRIHTTAEVHEALREAAMAHGVTCARVIRWVLAERLYALHGDSPFALIGAPGSMPYASKFKEVSTALINSSLDALSARGTQAFEHAEGYAPTRDIAATVGADHSASGSGSTAHGDVPQVQAPSAHTRSTMTTHPSGSRIHPVGTRPDVDARTREWAW